MKKAKVVEVFESIQGEGKNLGKPSVFVRLYGCNLRCRFNGDECDTPYAVNKGVRNVKFWTDNAIAKKVMGFKSTHLVFTGGEPLLFQPFIYGVIERIIKEEENIGKYTFEIETNGTIIPSFQLAKFNIWYNLSVKLKSSNQPIGQYNSRYEDRRKDTSPIKHFPVNASCFKFVVSDENDIKEILELHDEHPELPVYLMPEGCTRKDVIKHSPMVVELCKKHNFIFSPREHIIIWDTKKGV